jgi:hypothetical protein
MKECGGMEVYIHVFLTSALDEGQCSLSRHGHFTPRGRVPPPLPYQLNRRLSGPQSQSWILSSTEKSLTLQGDNIDTTKKTINKQTPWSESASELYRPDDRRLSAK